MQNVYAIGDVTAKLMLAHVAEAMGIVAAWMIAGVETMAIDFRFIPRATDRQPQIGSMGLSEAQAREAGHDVKMGHVPVLGAQRQGHGAGRAGRFRQGHRRRRAQLRSSEPPLSAPTSPSPCRSSTSPRRGI